MKKQIGRAVLLRTALSANAAFSASSGGAMMGFSSEIAVLMGAGPGWLYLALGAGLLVFAANLIFIATRPQVPAGQAMQASLGDFVWVIGTGILLAFSWAAFTLIGREILLGVAAIVALFGVLQIAGLAQSVANIHGRTKLKSRIDVKVRVEASPAAAWDVIQDLGGVSDYAEGVAKSVIETGQKTGVGVTRMCEDPKGGVWREKVVEWREGEEIVLEFDVKGPDNPLPAKEMIGGWTILAVDGAPKSADIHVWGELTMPFGIFGAALFAVGLSAAEKNFGDVIVAMEEDMKRIDADARQTA